MFFCFFDSKETKKKHRKQEHEGQYTFTIKAHQQRCFLLVRMEVVEGESKMNRLRKRLFINYSTSIFECHTFDLNDFDNYKTTWESQWCRK